jgi:hypothetical protein
LYLTLPYRYITVRNTAARLGIITLHPRRDSALGDLAFDDNVNVKVLGNVYYFDKGKFSIIIQVLNLVIR